MMKKILLLAMCIFCTLPCFATSNDIIENCNAKELQSILIKRAIKYNNQVENITDNSFTIKMPLSFWGQVLFSPNGMPSSAKAKMDFLLIQDGKNTMISASGSIISNDNSMTRWSTPMRFQDEFELIQRIKKYVQGYYTYNFEYKRKNNCIFVINKIDYELDTPVLAKDKIVEINGETFGNKAFLLSDSLEKKEEIKVKIIRKDWKTKKKETIEIVIKPYYIKPYEKLLD